MGKNIAVAYTMKKKSKHAQEKGVNPKSYEKGVSEAGRAVREAKEGDKEHHMGKMDKAKAEHQSVLEEMKEMPNPQLKASGGTVKSGDPTMNYADGGDVVEPTPPQAGSGPQMIDCPHCGKGFSHGGQVANSMEEGQAADRLPNEFDDLALRDGLEFKYTGKNSGDEDNDDDIVKRAMKKKR